MRTENHNRQYGAVSRVRDIQALFISEGSRALLLRSHDGQLVLPDCPSFGVREESDENVVCTMAGRIGLTVDVGQVHHLGTYQSPHVEPILVVQADVCASRRFFTRSSSIWVSPGEIAKLKNLSKVVTFAIDEWQRQLPFWRDQAGGLSGLSPAFVTA